MKKQIIHISVLQTSMILAILACIISALYAIPFGFYTLHSGDKDFAIAIFIQPILHLVVGFIAFVITFLIYNLVAKALGGIEITLNDKE